MKQKAKRFFVSLDIWVAGAALVILIVLTFANVIMRRVFNNPIQWTEEVQKICFLWITYIGAGAVFRSGGHVAIDIVLDMFPVKIQRAVESIVFIITLYVLGNLFVQCLTLVQQFGATDRVTNLLKIPYVLVYSAMPAGCINMIWNVLLVAYRKFRRREGEA